MNGKVQKTISISTATTIKIKRRTVQFDFAARGDRTYCRRHREANKKR